MEHDAVREIIMSLQGRSSVLFEEYRNDQNLSSIVVRILCSQTSYMCNNNNYDSRFQLMLLISRILHRLPKDQYCRNLPILIPHWLESEISWNLLCTTKLRHLVRKSKYQGPLRPFLKLSNVKSYVSSSSWLGKRKLYFRHLSTRVNASLSAC